MGFELYSSFAGDASKYIPGMSRLIMSYNSLWKLAQGKHLPRFDLIVVDELTQFHAHLFSKTFKGSQAIIAYQLLKDFLTSAGQVIGMDAHATDLDAQWIKTVTGDCLRIVNSYRHEWGSLTIHHRPETVLDRALAAIAGNLAQPLPDRQPVVITTYKEKSKLYARLIQERCPDARVIVVNSDISHSKRVRAFIRNINTRLTDYDVLVCSPSMATGIDVQTPVQGVYAVIPNRTDHFTVTNPADVLQQIARYRKAGERHIYLMGHTQDKTTQWEEIYHQELAKLDQTSDAADFQENGLQTPANHRDALKLWCQMQARHNRLTADLLATVVAMAKAEGFTIATCEDENRPLRKALSTLKKTIADETKAAIIAAQPVDHAHWNSTGLRTP